MKLCLPTQVVLCMKLTIVLLMVAGMQIVSAKGVSQSKVTISFSDAPLEKVLQSIAQQSSLKLWADPKLMDGFLHITIRLRNVELNGALAACLKGTGLGYRISGGQYLIVSDDVSSAHIATPELTPGIIDYRGIVLDEASRPLEGASVVVKGTMIGTESDGDGHFVLRGISQNSILVISYIGYEKREFKLSGKEGVSFVLKKSMNELDQTVIKGYYNTTERLNTGDVTTIKSDELEKHPVTDPLLAIEGQVPGLYISQASGLPGGYSKIMLMGKNSMINGGNPLFIIDGVPFNTVSLTNPDIGGGAINSPSAYASVTYNSDGYGLSPFNTLDPRDIESIVVLKDGDATAIYGSRGANGVVLITTKRGRAGESRVDVDMYTGLGYPGRQLKMMNTKDYLQMRREGIINDGQTVASTDYDINGVWDTTRSTDWGKVLLGSPASTTSANVNISGGNEATQFSVGGGYSRQTTSYSRNFADVKAMAHFDLTNLSLNNRLKTQLKASYANDNNKLPSLDLGQFITLAPDAPALFDNSGNLNWQMYGGSPTWNNPASALFQSVVSVSNTLIGSVNFDYRIVTGLHVKANLGYTDETMDERESMPGVSQPPPNNVNPNFRQLNTSEARFNNWIGEGSLNYSRKIMASNLDVVLGTTFEGNEMNTSTVLYSGFSDDALLENPAAASSVSSGGYYSDLYKYNSLFGRIGYNVKKRYLLNLTGRRDGSSRFGQGKQFGNFGAIGAGWIFSDEPFFKSLTSSISSGKLRISYGLTGNDQIADYQYLSSYSSSYLSYLGLAGLYPARLANSDYSWEIVKKSEGGIDIGFFNDRLLMTVNYYRNICDNQLVSYTLPSISGFTSVQKNLPANVENWGWEISAKYLGVHLRKFDWSSAVNLTVPKNRLLSYPGLESSPYANTFSVGTSIFSKKIFKYEGVNSQTGYYSFQTKNASGMPGSPQDIYSTKPITQLWFGGIQNTFSYDGIELDIFIQCVRQRMANSFGTGDLQMPGLFNMNEPNAILNRWRSSGDNSNYQRYSAGYDGNAFTLFTDYGRSDAVYSTNASFVRIKNVSLSYRFSNRLVHNIHMKSMRVYFLAENLFTFTKYLGEDPETLGMVTPPSRIITFGFSLSL